MNLFVDKYFKSIVIVMLAIVLLFLGGFKVVEIVSPKTAGISDAILESTFGAMMDKKNLPILSRLDAIEKNQPKMQDNPMILLLEFHLNNWIDPNECYESVKLWEDQAWGSQITAIKYVARNPEAMKYLKSVTVYESVYKAFAMKVAKY